MNDDEKCEARRPRFDGTINLGHILTASAMLLGGIVVWSQSLVVQAKQDLRINYLEKTMGESTDAVKKVAETQQQMVLNQAKVSTALDMLVRNQKPPL